MWKFVGGAVVGVLGTLLVCFVVMPIISDCMRDSDEGIPDRLHVQKNKKTGHLTVRAGWRTPFVNAGDGDPMIGVDVDETAHFRLRARMTPNSTLEHVCLHRKDGVWDGLSFTDEVGQRWEHMGAESHQTAYLKKYGELALRQAIWFGRIRTDGKDVFFEDVYNGKVRSTWRKLSEPIVLPK